MELLQLSVLLSCVTVVASITSKSSGAALKLYSFENFVSDFNRNYGAVGSVEYERRASLFRASVARVQNQNAREGRRWTAGVQRFMDWTASEKAALNGYKPARAPGSQKMVALQLRGASRMSLNATTIVSRLGATGGMSMAEGPEIRDQGNCGSCWAISAAEAVEAQLIRKAGIAPKVSAQALVDCVPNPNHCGGSGGCDGATGELAYAFMRDTGIPLEDDLPYTASTDACPVSNLEAPWPVPRRARVSSWNNLPSNRAAPLMQALVENGPVVVAVDGSPWYDYESGIFDGCSKDAVLSHAVLAKGYGEDAGQKYWLIQNSWGSGWGERGHIRLLRFDQEGEWCGTDRKPKEGVGCDGGPSEVTVCGMCGLLYDPLIPEGVHVEEAGTAAEAEVPHVPPAGLLSHRHRVSHHIDNDLEMDELLKQFNSR